MIEASNAKHRIPEKHGERSNNVARQPETVQV